MWNGQSHYHRKFLIAAIAIPIGLVIGNVIGYFLIPAGWYWLTTLCVTVGVGLFAFIIVMIENIDIFKSHTF